MNRPITYLAIGDSLTEGIGAENREKCFVEGYFRYIRCTSQCRVVNYGRSGMVSAELLRELTSSSSLRSILPEVNEVTISIGGNDLIQVAQQNVSLVKVLQVTDHLIHNLKGILSQINENSPKAKIVLLGLYMPNITTNKWMPIATTFLRRVNKHYRQVAHNSGAMFADPFEVFFSKPELFYDEVHPNNKGYEQLTDILIKLRSESRVTAPTIQI
jgi:lysophospholipase L1-like esterase